MCEYVRLHMCLLCHPPGSEDTVRLRIQLGSGRATRLEALIRSVRTGWGPLLPLTKGSVVVKKRLVLILDALATILRGAPALPVSLFLV